MVGGYDFTVKVPDAMQQMSGVLNVANAFKERELADRQMQMKEQTFKATQQKAMRFQRDLADLADNPTPENTLRIWAKNPEQHEAFKGFLEAASEQEKEQSFATQRDLYMLAKNEKYDEALSLINERQEAARNSGNAEQARMLDIYKMNLDPNSELYSPGNFIASVGVGLSAMDRGRKMLESMATQDKYKSDIDFKKFDMDQRKLETRLKVERAKFNRAKEQRDQEKHAASMEETQRKLQELESEKQSKLDSSASSMDNMINTIDRAISMDVGDVYSDVLGPVSSRTPTIGQEEADFEEVIELLSNQSFMAQVPTLTGLGALSDAEGRKLSNSLQTLSLRQSPESMRKSLKEARRLISKSREFLFKKHGIKQTIPDTPYAIKTLDDVTLTTESSFDIGALLDKELGISQ